MKYFVVYTFHEANGDYTYVRRLKQDESGEWLAHDDSENDLFFHLHESGSWEYCGYNWYDIGEDKWFFFPDDELDFAVVIVDEEENTDIYGDQYYTCTVVESDKVSYIKMRHFIDRFGTDRICVEVKGKNIEFSTENGELYYNHLSDIVSKPSAREFYEELCLAANGDRTKTGGGIMSEELIADHLGISEYLATEYLWACARYGITERQGGAWVA